MTEQEQQVTEETQTTQHSGPNTIQDQLMYLQYLFDNQLYGGITPDIFNKLPPVKVALARFFAINNTIQGVENAMVITADTELRAHLGGLVTNLIRDRDEGLKSVVSNYEESSEKLMADNVPFQPSGEASQALMLVVNMGLVDQLKERNFPFLLALSQQERAYLELLTLGNQRTHLASIHTGSREIGLSNLPGMPNVNLKTESKTMERRFRDALERFTSPSD